MRRTIIIAIGLALIIPFAYATYSSESFRTILRSYASILNRMIFVSILLKFILSLKAYLEAEELDKLKTIGAISGVISSIYLVTLLSLNLSGVHKIQTFLILIDIALLSLLPFLTSPLSVAKNRAR